MAVDGTYVLERSENLEGFLKSIGVKDDTIQKFAAARPTLTLKLTDSSLEVVSKAKEEHKNILKLGSPSNYTMATGFEFEITLTVSGNTGKGTLKKGAKSGNIIIDFTDSGFVETFNIEGHVCKRFYTKI